MRKTRLTVAAVGAAVTVIVTLAGCGGSASPGTSVSSSAAAAPATTAAPSPTGPTPAQCAQQMQAWLAAPAANAPVPADTNQQVISAIVFDADAYLHYGPGGPDAQADATESGQNFLTAVGTEVSFMGSDIPSCADPGQDISGTGSGSLMGDATDAGDDTSGSPQTTTDSGAVTTDLNATNQELLNSAPGVQISGLAAGTTW
jgi:hypothetical protein